jgi:hypothetical protein
LSQSGERQKVSAGNKCAYCTIGAVNSSSCLAPAAPGAGGSRKQGEKPWKQLQS